MKNSTETSAFKKPLNLSKKRPEVAPGIGEYDQSNYTIQADLKKNAIKYASKFLKLL